MHTRRRLRVAGFATLIVGTLAAGVLTAPAAFAATPVPGDPLTGSGGVSRSVVTRAQLQSTTNPGGVVDSTAGFGVPAGAAAPSHSFQGTLRINNVNTAATTGFAKVYAPAGGYDYFGTASTWYRYLPYNTVIGSNYALQQKFVQNGSHLIPTVRGLQVISSLNYNILWSPGRAWDESGDVIGGVQYTRAAIPFTLVFKEANCSFSGLLTFLFTDTAMTRVRYQVSSETCAYYKGNLWGNLTGTYTASTVSGAEALRNAYAAEVASRMPTKPISSLAADYPAAGIDTSAFTSGITAAHITSYGFVYNGTNYVSGCVTRRSNSATDATGLHPYCEQVILPSYSTAKSAFMGTALMRLAQKYGIGVRSELVKDWVPELASDATWSTVTFGQLVDMATGHYTSDGYEVDEAGTTMASFFALSNSTRAAKMSAATSFPSKVAPGTKWVYHTSDSFLLSAAMNAYLKSKEGASADIWNMTYGEVLAPIGVSPDSAASARTTDAGKTPWGGYGLFWSRDGLARVGEFFAGGDGSHGGVQLLSASMVDDALQRDPSDPGLPTADQPFLYNEGFWARPFTSADDAAYTTPFSVPFMSGYGGITVALMPNCSAFYMVNDAQEYSWKAVVRESNKLHAMTAGCS
ncbi:hypothetical protein [Microbacterium sp. TNHR37B]|uniref:hypothetical protein n=1 Tax=Microbacterium sp. TNHR37B TaxID=1775956 RepID=UPI0007B1A2BC|nr:hypothetical protein [Microbacterium sp. TNHR37B]KZE91549.1 hypothetical protein AVP41_01092 [Microbacterium sp. TNHR37B]